MSKKFVYLFKEGDASMRELLGGKGANLAEMTKIGLPVPQGFTISTQACTQYYEDGRQINDSIRAEIMEYIEKLEARRWVPPFGNLRVNGYVLLTAAYRSLSRPSSAPSAKASALCSFSLDLMSA